MKNFEAFRLLCVKNSLSKKLLLNPNLPTFIFGVGKFGRDIADVLRRNKYEVSGFIETNPKHKEVDGLPVYSWSELNALDKQQQIAIGIFNRMMPMDELQSLAEQVGFVNIFMPWHIYEQFSNDLGWRYWLGGADIITNALSHIEDIYHKLSDDLSKQCMLDILTFRLGQKTAYASFKHDDNQYFNALTLASIKDKNLTFIDGGAYNGDTYLALLALAKVHKAFLFEPDPHNFTELINNTRSLKGEITCLPLAIADQYAIHSFTSDGGEGGALDTIGDQYIATVALDDVFHNQAIDFIKLDVEGAEIAALNGAGELIARCFPILAVSLYHKPQDLWKIPEVINILSKDYRLYIRQHYFNSFDSVLYAIPT
jgi:FkbM family methyltransferase